MYCLKCGAPLPPGSQFCANCGTKVETIPAQNMEPTASANAQPNVGPITPPATNQPYGYRQSPKKKSKALLWTLISVAVVLIAAAVLYFVVLAPASANGPFSGNTVQTRFANDAVGVFFGAFSGYGNNDTAKQLVDQPFDISMNVSNDFSGIQSNVDIAAAYDEKALGMSITSSTDYSNSDFADFFADSDAMENTIKLLLLDDTLYADVDGSVEGLQFDTDADLSESMSLKERIAALMDSGKENSIDYLKLTEMFLNSIDEERIYKGTNKTTLTLDADALADTLDVFADKLRDDEELNDALSKIIEDVSGYAYDASDLISLASPMLSESDFEFVWTVTYDGGKPICNEISMIESGAQLFEVVFQYEDNGNTREIIIDLTADGQPGTVDILLTKTAKGFDYEGTISVPDSDEIAFSGWQETSGNNITGSVEITSADIAIMSSNTEATITIGMPDDVEDDNRFEMDTNNAWITNFGDLFDSGLSDNVTYDIEDILE